MPGHLALFCCSTIHTLYPHPTGRKKPETSASPRGATCHCLAL
jgi:hypothetical protein